MGLLSELDQADSIRSHFFMLNQFQAAEVGPTEMVQDKIKGFYYYYHDQILIKAKLLIIYNIFGLCYNYFL